jgi:hypothetical protein
MLKELAKGHHLSLLHRGNLRAAHVVAQHAARAAAAHRAPIPTPPVFLPFFCERAQQLLFGQFIRKSSNLPSYLEEACFSAIRPYGGTSPER